jgi:hypothetical protein
MNNIIQNRSQVNFKQHHENYSLHINLHCLKLLMNIFEIIFKITDQNTRKSKKEGGNFNTNCFQCSMRKKRKIMNYALNLRINKT